MINNHTYNKKICVTNNEKLLQKFNDLFKPKAPNAGYIDGVSGANPIAKNAANVINKKVKVPIKSSGFTAIELMFGLGVIAIGTIALVWASRGNTNTQNANTMVSDVSTMVQNIQSGFGSSASGYSNLTNETAISMNLIPGDLIIPTGTSTINSKFQGGTVEIASGAANDNFTITYTNVPSAVCNKAVSTLGGATFSNVTINGTSVYDTASQLQLDPTAVGTACSANKDAATVVFTAS